MADYYDNESGFNQEEQNTISQENQTSRPYYQYTEAPYRSIYQEEQSSSTRRPAKEKKKSSGLFKKSLLAIFLGLLLGVSASAGFLTIQYLSELFDSKKAPVAQEEIAPESQIVTETEKEIPTQSEIDRINPQTITAVVTDVTDVVEKVMPSVVSITNTATITQQSFWGQRFEREAQSSGSGIIVGENDTELLIASNNHVVAESDSLKVQFINGTVAEAKIKGTDSNVDLAVIAVKLEDLDVETKNEISIATLGDSDILKVGEPAIAIGNALGYGQSVTTGVISALNRQIEMDEEGSTTGTLIQTDAAINPGNSGGALLNMKGEVIGINSNKIGGSTIEGMGYAIPISTAKPIVQELMIRETKDKVDAAKKGYLGISGLNVTEDVVRMYGMPKGVYVTQVNEGGAKKAGMLKGDIITSFDGSSVGSMEDLQGYLEYYEAGETVMVTVLRSSSGEYAEMNLLITLGAQPESR